MRGTLVKQSIPTKCGDILGAKGNSGDMVIKVMIGRIGATKYLTRMRYGFNDQGKLDIHIDRNIEMRNQVD